MPVAQLKIMQEAITLIVFSGFSIWFLRERLKWNDFAAFACIFGAVFFAFIDKWQPETASVQRDVCEAVEADGQTQ